MSDEPIGRLFPLGGPVPRELIIGRYGEIDDIERRLHERLSTMVLGPRRIGKTTVCNAVCGRIKEAGALVVQVDVPERPDSEALLQQIIDSCSRLSLQAIAEAALPVARPLVEQILGEVGLPLDLSALGTGSEQDDRLPTRAVLDLPAEMARREHRPALLFLDELQRVASYRDGDEVLHDLIDLYGASDDVVLLVDGSEARALEQMFGAPVHFGKLVDRVALSPRIPVDVWRAPLTARFASAGLRLPATALERILGWSEGHPYATIAAARYTALSARRTGSATIGDFDGQMGLDEAERHLEDDGA